VSGGDPRALGKNFEPDQCSTPSQAVVLKPTWYYTRRGEFSKAGGVVSYVCFGLDPQECIRDIPKNGVGQEASKKIIKLERR